MSGWIIDEQGLVECDCGRHGDAAKFQVVVNERFEVVNLECAKCGTIYDVSEFKKECK